MTSIVFTSAGHPARTIDAANGASIMEVARDAGIPGIIGDCGGEMICGTCHVYIEERFLDALPLPTDDERAMIEDGVLHPQANSRLCCQLTVSAPLDGMSVSIPRQF